MGSFHGRRKPSAKKASKPKGDTSEDIAARQARDQFIKDMAAKAAAAAAPVEGSDNGGIHPSRLARADPFSGGQPNSSYAQHRQPEKPARGQRAPDLRQNNNKRTFDTAMHTESNRPVSDVTTKKQRTLQEIRKLKGPAAMKKEEEKRRRQAEAGPANEIANVQAKVQQNSAVEAASEDDDTPIPSKHGKKGIKEEKKATKTPEEKAQRKLEKAARKAAKSQSGSQSDSAVSEPDIAPAAKSEKSESETKEARKARKRSEKAAKQAVEVETDHKEVITKQSETKAERKERKRLAKLAKNETVPEVAIEMDEKPVKEKKAPKKDKKSRGSAVSEEVHPPTETVAAKNNWISAATSLGLKSSKFMKLLGGAKNGITMADSTNSEDQVEQKVSAARKAEKDLQRQYEAGIQAKQSGRHRGGLGA